MTLLGNSVLKVDFIDLFGRVGVKVLEMICAVISLCRPDLSSSLHFSTTVVCPAVL